jgi:ribonuclease D
MPINIFCSYAKKDQQFLDNLKKHLNSFLQRKNSQIWASTDIGAGREWEEEINKNLEKADIILLLISPDFMHSEYCWKHVNCVFLKKNTLL